MSDTITREQLELLFDKLLDVEELDYQEQLALCRLALKSFDQPAPPKVDAVTQISAAMVGTAPPSTLMGMEVKFSDGLSGEQFFIQPSQPAPPADVVEKVAEAIHSASMGFAEDYMEGKKEEARAAIRALSEANLLKEQK